MAGRSSRQIKGSGIIPQAMSEHFVDAAQVKEDFVGLPFILIRWGLERLDKI